MKGMFHKTVGGGLLTRDELSEVLLDIEITINNRPLNYMEEDVELPTLTPNSMLFLNPNYLPELGPRPKKRFKSEKASEVPGYTKEQMWRRWWNEYIHALRERHNLKYQTKKNGIAPGDVMLIKSDRNKWPLGIVEKLFVLFRRFDYEAGEIDWNVRYNYYIHSN